MLSRSAVPELPEVEIVRRGLAAALIGHTVVSVDIIGALGPRSVRRHLAGPADFAAAVAGHIVIDVRRRGKYLWWVLDGGDAVLAHLGMSGQFRVHDVGCADDGASHHAPGGTRDVALGPHTRLRLWLAGSAGGAAGAGGTESTGGTDLTAAGRIVDFVDQRTFGGLMFVPGGADLPAPIAHIARDPLDPAFDRTRTVAAIRRKHSGIKRVLLDQTVVSGIGNIYADEALWTARLRYDRPADSLSARAAGAVIDATIAVMRSALEAGGTSFDALYVNVNGESGYFDRSLNAYGRAGAPCRRCGTPIRRVPFMNRSSFFCPRCQRAGRSPTR